MRRFERVVGGALVVTAALIVAPSAPAAVTPADRVATHAYLLAEYEYDEALIAAGPVQEAAVDAAASSIGAECAGVLAGAPQHELRSPLQLHPNPRREGEESRLHGQLSALKFELRSSLSLAASQPVREAESVFANKLKRLRWSDPLLTGSVRYEAEAIERQAREVQPPVCADMRAWVTSGYRILAPASKALVEHEERDLAPFLFALEPLPNAEFDGPADEALERRLDVLRSRVSEGRLHEQVVYARTLSAVGMAPSQRELEPPHKIAPPFEIGRRRTASGGRYAVWLRVSRGTGDCKAGVEVRQSGRGRAFECVPGSGADRPRVKCVGGLLTVELVTGAAARSVELRLSDGSQIRSRPIAIPARYGGPRGLYYQQVRGPSPIPVALIELGVRGHRLRAIKLEPLKGCTKHPFKYLPGGFRVLAQGNEPRGPRFAIVAEHFRLFGVVHFKLRFAENVTAGELRRTRQPEGLEWLFEDEEGLGEMVEAVPGHPGRFAAPSFQSHVESGCHPYEHSLVYGLLKSRRERVFVKVAGRIHQLRRVPIPADMHAGGDALAYGAFPSSPEEVFVRAAGRRVIFDENRRSDAKEERETCEGEAEGAGPTVGQDGGIF